MTLGLTEAANKNSNQNNQSLISLKEQVEIFLSERTQGLSEEVAISVIAFDPRLSLAKCNSLDMFFSGNNRAWGKTSVGIRCLSPVRWTIYAQAHVSVIGNYPMTNVNLSQGQTIERSDLVLQRGDLTLLPSNVITRIDDVVGRQAKITMSSGSLVKAENISFPIVVQQGQKVRIYVSGEGFTLATDGVALNSAIAGDTVRARVVSGQTVQGQARENGQVEVLSK